MPLVCKARYRYLLNACKYICIHTWGFLYECFTQKNCGHLAFRNNILQRSDAISDTTQLKDFCWYSSVDVIYNTHLYPIRNVCLQPKGPVGYDKQFIQNSEPKFYRAEDIRKVTIYYLMI